MMRRAAVFPLLLVLPACADETVSGYADPAAVYRLEGADMTIAFPAQGQIAGKGPCNTYSAAQTAPYPWFETGPILSTKRTCPGLTDELDYFAALGRMTLAEVSGPVLILSNEAGEELAFTAD